MVTTREFIGVAMWHCLKNPELHQLMLNADQEARYAFLHELLRLEPVVGSLYRRTTNDLTLEHGTSKVAIAAGSLIELHSYAINAEESVVGQQPLQLCPSREMVESASPKLRNML